MMKILLFILSILMFSGSYAQNKISGNVFYSNSTLTYLDSVTVYLKQGQVLVNQTNTDAYGYFVFSNVLNGTYSLSASCNKAWGGGNSSDAAAILSHFVGLSPLRGIKLKAANVDDNVTVNTMDAILVSRRFIQLVNSFSSGDWAVEQKMVTLNGAPVRQNLKAACYGDVNASYSPPAQFVCGQPLTDTRDNQVYPTVLIGEQCWMAKNLNVGTFIFGVGDQTNNYVIEKYCYQNITSNCTSYGGLYQWGEMMQYASASSGQGICPAGWHIPANQEFDTLIYQLGGYAVAGTALKVGGNSGFEGLLAGWVYNCQKFRHMGVEGFFWTSSSYNNLYAHSRILTWNTSAVTSIYENKQDGLSVRCLKD